LAVSRKWAESAILSLLLYLASPYYWNSLPYNVQNSVSITSFKRALKTFLFRYNMHIAH